MSFEQHIPLSWWPRAILTSTERREITSHWKSGRDYFVNYWYRELALLRMRPARYLHRSCFPHTRNILRDLRITLSNYIAEPYEMIRFKDLPETQFHHQHHNHHQSRQPLLPNSQVTATAAANGRIAAATATNKPPSPVTVGGDNNAAITTANNHANHTATFNDYCIEALDDIINEYANNEDETNNENINDGDDDDDDNDYNNDASSESTSTKSTISENSYDIGLYMHLFSDSDDLDIDNDKCYEEVYMWLSHLYDTLYDDVLNLHYDYEANVDIFNGHKLISLIDSVPDLWPERLTKALIPPSFHHSIAWYNFTKETAKHFVRMCQYTVSNLFFLIGLISRHLAYHDTEEEKICLSMATFMFTAISEQTLCCALHMLGKPQWVGSVIKGNEVEFLPEDDELSVLNVNEDLETIVTFLCDSIDEKDLCNLHFYTTVYTQPHPILTRLQNAYILIPPDFMDSVCCNGTWTLMPTMSVNRILSRPMQFWRLAYGEQMAHLMGANKPIIQLPAKFLFEVYLTQMLLLTRSFLTLVFTKHQENLLLLGLTQNGVPVPLTTDGAMYHSCHKSSDMMNSRHNMSLIINLAMAHDYACYRYCDESDPECFLHTLINKFCCVPQLWSEVIEFGSRAQQFCFAYAFMVIWATQYRPVDAIKAPILPECGLSFVGLYDLAMLQNRLGDVDVFAAEIAEFLYMGALTASISISYLYHLYDKRLQAANATSMPVTGSVSSNPSTFTTASHQQSKSYKSPAHSLSVHYASTSLFDNLTSDSGAGQVNNAKMMVAPETVAVKDASSSNESDIKVLSDCTNVNDNTSDDATDKDILTCDSFDNDDNECDSDDFDVTDNDEALHEDCMFEFERQGRLSIYSHLWTLIRPYYKQWGAYHPYVTSFRLNPLVAEAYNVSDGACMQNAIVPRTGKPVRLPYGLSNLVCRAPPEYILGKDDFNVPWDRQKAIYKAIQPFCDLLMDVQLVIDADMPFDAKVQNMRDAIFEFYNDPFSKCASFSIVQLNRNSK